VGKRETERSTLLEQQKTVLFKLIFSRLQWNRNEFPFGSHLSSANELNHIYSKQALHLQ
jgi:hypothetical protein